NELSIRDLAFYLAHERRQLGFDLGRARCFAVDLARISVPKRQRQRHADSELVLVRLGALVVRKRTDAHSRPAFIERELDLETLLLQLDRARANVVIALACRPQKRRDRRKRLKL